MRRELLFAISAPKVLIRGMIWQMSTRLDAFADVSSGLLFLQEYRSKMANMKLRYELC
jgi:hypothetical protein